MFQNPAAPQRPDLLSMPQNMRRMIVPNPEETLVKDGRKKPHSQKANHEEPPFRGAPLLGLSNTV